ncbi:hypothetical protein EDB89DRAFT_2207094 [Lactarius sanguifluus]|nr:hypothetical protein EDB89DRAFT_2207094 [Lactarius sanguifluus]
MTELRFKPTFRAASLKSTTIAYDEDRADKPIGTICAIPANWECLGDPSAGITIDLRIVLSTSSPPTPAHIRTHVFNCRYGEHLSKEQVAELVAPSLDTLELVNSWLKHHGVSPTSISRTHGGGWLTVSSVPVSRANEMLGVLYWHAGTNDNFPHVLYAHVQTIAPMTRTHFASMPVLCCSRPHAPASMEKRHVLSRCDVRVTPVFLRVLYGTVKYEPAATGRNVLGVTGYLGQYPSPSDLVEQVNGGGNNRNDRTPVTRRISTFNHPGNNVSSPARLLQLRWLTAVQTRWQLVNELERAVPRVDYLHNLQGPIPLTIATSYGGNEQTVPEQSVCTLFARFGLRGISILFASGDGAVGGGDYLATTTRAKTASSPSSPHPVPGSLVSAVRGARPKTGASFCGGFSNYFRAMSTRWHSESLPRKLGDMYKARTSLGAAASPHSRPTIRSSFAVTFGYGGHKLLSAHASFPSLPLLSEPSILGHPADHSLTDSGGWDLAAE